MDHTGLLSPFRAQRADHDAGWRAAVLDAIERVWARHDQGDIDDLIAAAFGLDRGGDPGA